jgi:hypothetical protein
LDVIAGASPCRDRVAVDSIREARATWCMQRLPLTSGRLDARWLVLLVAKEVLAEA